MEPPNWQKRRDFSGRGSVVNNGSLSDLAATEERQMLASNKKGGGSVVQTSIEKYGVV